MDPLLLMLIVFAVMLIPMFLMSNRQRKAMREQQERVAQMGVGDEVRTHSGFYGLIVEEYDDVVILETESGAQTKWARQALAMKVEPTDQVDPVAAPADSVEEAPQVEAPAAEQSDFSREDRGDGTVPGVTTPRS